MMKISKNSLAYKIARYGNKYVHEGHDLCSFVRSFLLGCLDILLHSAAAIVITILVGMLAYGLLIAPIYAFFSGMTMLDYLNQPSSVVAIILWPVIIIASIAECVSYFNRKRVLDGTPSILVTVVKDKFKKVCTRIEFV